MMNRIGLDVGSTTAKMVVIDEQGTLVWHRYERHNARVKELLDEYLREVAEIICDSEVQIAVTGSVGMATAEMLGAQFVQEVVAATTFVRQRYPEAKALIDIGGEDSKVVLLDGGCQTLRMNGNCAGGTGAFIDQMAQLLSVTPTELNDLAMQSEHQYTIAARCGVFAKTDVQNLISRGASKADIAASIFHSVAVQTVTTLVHGCDIHTPILLCGGPLTFLPALRRAFADYMDCRESDFIVGKHGNLIPAIGCALTKTQTTTNIMSLVARLRKPQTISLSSNLEPLFGDDAALSQWQLEKDGRETAVLPMKAQETIVLGIDSGSTTTKIIAARQNGDILFSHYAQSLGNPIKAVSDGLILLKEKAAATNTRLDIVGSCSTGYGEELIKAAFSLDSGIIETMAHYRAAKHLTPNVSFILDIGGQDMKAIFVDKGVVTRMELNEACSSGCGTFLQTFAQSLGYSIEDFARMACTAQHPCDLGTRCTVFMNSKIKQVLREGADVSDIAAGLAYSVVNNCLYKVLKLKSIDELGDKIVVQGGTMRNNAVVRALERLTGKTVARSTMPEMMGAYGCALHAAEHLSEPRSIDELIAATKYETKASQCGGCENRCHIVRYLFANGGRYVSGNKCERIFNNHGRQIQPGRNIYAEKLRLLWSPKLGDDRGLNKGMDCACSDPQPPNLGGLKIGLPRVLNMYENYPFWHRLLIDCGFEVVLSGESTMPHYESQLCTVMSDNICFPAKLVHSHVAELSKAGVERILMPYVVYERNDCPSATNSYNCPIVSGYSDVIRSAMDTQVPVDSPVINFSNERLLERQIAEYLHGLGIDKQTAHRAFLSAIKAQREYEAAIKQTAIDILNESRRQGRLTIVLAGRPYHADPLIQHRLSDTIAAMGVDVISEDIVRNAPELADGETNSVRQWAYVNRIIKAAQWAAEQDGQVQFVELTSFGCGPDAFIQDEVRSLLNRYGKTLTLLKIDDVTNVGSLKLRVRSLIESLQMQASTGVGGDQRSSALQTTRAFTKNDRRKKILAPHISEFITPLLPAFGALAGYDVEVLPPSDAESAAIGLQYANNEVCYPATLIVGDIIKALQSGRYDTQRIAVAMSQTGGQCRATNYAGLIKRAMVQAGFSHVPLITLGVTTKGTDNEQEGFDMPWIRIAPMVFDGLLFADSIAKMYYAAEAHLSQEGMAVKLRDKFLRQGAECIRKGDRKRLLWTLSNAASEFNLISDGEQHPVSVGIVGEIFLKFNHFAHQHITSTLISRGFEVVPPLITPFFLQEFVNAVRNQQLGLTDIKGLKGLAVPLIVKLLYRLASRRIHQFNAATSHYRYFRPFIDIRDTARKADNIVSPAAQFGEGWLLPGDIMEMVDGGIKNIISLQPFGCIANHIVAKGIEKALLRQHPDLNLLTLDFDSGVSAVNITNRLLLFLDGAA